MSEHAKVRVAHHRRRRKNIAAGPCVLLRWRMRTQGSWRTAGGPLIRETCKSKRGKMITSSSSSWGVQHRARKPRSVVRRASRQKRGQPRETNQHRAKVKEKAVKGPPREEASRVPGQKRKRPARGMRRDLRRASQAARGRQYHLTSLATRNPRAEDRKLKLSRGLVTANTSDDDTMRGVFRT